MKFLSNYHYITAISYYTKKKKPQKFEVFLEATIGFEPMMRVLQTRALPLGYVAIFDFK